MTTVARALVDRVFAVSSPPETVHSDQGPELENELVRELQSVFGFKAALYTIVPRSPFFSFCTPKYFRLQKCG